MAVFASDLSGVIVEQIQTPIVGTSDATDYIAQWQAPRDIYLISVHFRPSDAVTGAATNTRHLNLDNAGVAGSGTTEIGNIDYGNGTDSLAGAENALYAPATPVFYAAGNLFKLESEEIGTGQGMSQGTLVFRYYNA